MVWLVIESTSHGPDKPLLNNHLENSVLDFLAVVPAVVEVFIVRQQLDVVGDIITVSSLPLGQALEIALDRVVLGHEVGIQHFVHAFLGDLDAYLSHLPKL